MFQSLYSQIALAALLVVCGLAIWKGSEALRAGAVMILITWFVTLAASAVTRSYVPAVAFLASDGILAAGLLFLAVRYSNWWMGAAMLLQAIGLSLHAAYFAAEKSDLSRHTLWLYIAGKNVASLAMLLVILAATIISILRSRPRKADAPAPAMPSRVVPT
jgi:hypothetical protein